MGFLTAAAQSSIIAEVNRKKKQLTWGVLTTKEFETCTYFGNDDDDDNGGDDRRRRRCVVQAMEVFRDSANFVMIFLWDGLSTAIAVLPRHHKTLYDWNSIQKGTILQIKKYGFNIKRTIVLEGIHILQQLSPILFNIDGQNFGDDTVHSPAYLPPGTHAINRDADLLPPGPMPYDYVCHANSRDAFDRQIAPSQHCNGYSDFACSKSENIFQSSPYDFGHLSRDPYAHQTVYSPCVGAITLEEFLRGTNSTDWVENLNHQKAGEVTAAEGHGTGDLVSATEEAATLLSNNKKMNQNYKIIEDNIQLLQKELLQKEELQKELDELDDSLVSSSKGVANQEIYPCDMAGEDAAAEGDASGELVSAAEEVAALSMEYQILPSKYMETNNNYINLEDKVQMLQQELDDNIGYSSSGAYASSKMKSLHIN